ncbi:hypothetical protein SAZ_40830 [Streptomyces noursei ZPM]|nr:hypothetical protein SAZ_40830 [Streptomyces noursei ZPM]
MPEDGGGLGADEVGEQAQLVGFGEGADPGDECGGVGRFRSGAPVVGEGTDLGQCGEQGAGAGGGEQRGVALPVHVGDGDGDVLADHGAAQFGQGRGRVEQAEALAAQGRGDRVVGGHAGLGPRAPGDGGGGQPAGATMQGERVEVGVGGSVGALVAAAPDAGDGAEEDEEVQFAVAEQGVEVGGAGELGGGQGGEVGGAEAVERSVVADAGGVHDAGQRQFPGQVGEERGERFAVGGVAGDDGDRRPEFGQLGPERGGPGGVGAATAGEDEVLGAGAGQPAGDLGAQAAGAAGDQDGAGRGELPGRGQLVDGVPDQPPAGHAAGPQRHLVLAVGDVLDGEDAGEPLPGPLVEDVRQVDQAAPQPGVLQGDAATQPPGGGLDGVGDRVVGAGGDGAAGGGPQSAPGVGVGEGLDERHGQRQSSGERRAVVRGPFVERQHGQHLGGGVHAVGPGQPLGEAPAIRAGVVEDEAVHAGAVGAEGVGQCVQEVGVVGRGGVGGHQEPGAVEYRGGGLAQPRPLHPVAQGVEEVLLLVAAPPGREGGQQGVQRRVVLGVQPEDGGELPGVAALDRGPEPLVGGVGGGGGRGGQLRPVVLVLEGIGRQVGAAGAGPGQVPGPVHVHAAHLEAGHGGGRGRLLGASGAQHRHQFDVGVVAERVLGHRGEQAVGAQLHEGGGAGLPQRPHAVGEPHGLADVPHPVLRGARLRVVGAGAGEVVDQGDARRPVRQPFGDGAEGRRHPVHVRRVEGVAHPQPLGLPSARGEGGGDLLGRGLVAGDDHGLRPVDGGEGHRVGEVSGDLFLGGLDRVHGADGRQCLHQRRPCGDQAAGVREVQHPGDVRRGDPADRVARHQVGPDAPALHPPVQRDLDGEQRGLGPPGLVQQGGLFAAVLGEHHLAQRPVQQRVERGADLVERRGEPGLSCVEFTSHRGPLAALSGEQHGDPAASGGFALDDGGVRPAGGERAQRGAQLVVVLRHDGGPPFEAGPGGGQGERDVHERGVRPVLEVLEQPGGLAAQGVPGAPGQEQRHGAGRTPRCTGRVRRPGSRRLFDDDVHVGAADPERGDAGAAGPAGLRPGGLLGQQFHRALGPVHVRGRRVDVQGPGEDAVPHRQHHLDDAGDTGRGLGVPDVGLHRTQQQRLPGITVTAVGGEERLGLDRVAERRAGAVRLDDVHVTDGETAAGECLADDPLLGRTVGRRQAVRRAVLVDGRTAHHRQDLMTVADRVRLALQHQHAHALGPADAIRRVRERLAPPIGRQTPLPGEVHEHRRRRHHRHPTGQRQPTLTTTQRLHRPVQRHQRRRTRRIDRHRRALQTQRVRHPTRRQTRRTPTPLKTLELRTRQHRAVIAVHHTRENTRRTAPQAQRVNTRPFHRLPRRLQQQPLLRIGRQRLPRTHPEEARIELPGLVEESARTRVGRARVIRVRVVEGLDVPTAVGRESGDRVGAFGEELPQVLGRADAARVAAGHADDDDRVVRDDRAAPRRGCHLGLRAQEFVAEVGGEVADGRVVEDQGGGQAQTGGGVEAVTEFDRGQGVEAEVAEGAAGVHVVTGGVAEDPRDLAADEVQDQFLAPLLVESAQTLGEVVGGGGSGACGTAGPDADQRPQQRGYFTLRPQDGKVQPDRNAGRIGTGQGRVEEGQPLRHRKRRNTGTTQPVRIGIRQRTRHPTGPLPRPPRQRHTRQTGCPPLRHQRVQERIRRRVVALTRTAERPRHRREHHERAQAHPTRRLMQMPRRIHLRPQHRRQPLRRQPRNQPVIQHPGRMHHSRHPMTSHQPQHRSTIGHIAGNHPHHRTGLRQLGDQLGRTRRPFTTATHQQQLPHTVLDHQMTGQHRTQTTRTTSDQHRTRTTGEPRTRTRRRLPRRQRPTDQTGGPQGVTVHGELRFVADQGGDREGGGVRGRIEVEEGEAARVLGLGRTHQAPHRSTGHVVPGRRAPGHEDQARGGQAFGAGEPGLHGGERFGGAAVRGRGRVGCVAFGARSGEAGEGQQDGGRGRAVGRGERGEVRVAGAVGESRVGPQSEGVAADQGHRVGRGGGRADGSPVEAEEGVPGERGGGVELLVGDAAQDERVDVEHGGPGVVGDREGEGVVGGRGQADAQGGGAARVQGDALPGERQAAAPAFAEAGEGGGVQGGVEQRGVEAERLGVGPGGLRQDDLGVDGPVQAPGGVQAPEGGAVGESGVGEPVVVAVEGQWFGVGRGPLGGVEGGLRVAGGGGVGGGEDAGGVGGPRGVVAGVGARVDVDGASAGGVGGADPQLDLDAAVLGQEQRCGEGEFFDAVAADLVAGADGEFEEGGAGQQGGAADGVVGEPGVGLPGEAAGEEHATGVGEGDGGGQQRVVGGAEADGGQVGGGALEGLGPVAAALEGVGGQGGAAGAGAGEVTGPVEGGAVHVQAGQSGGEGVFLGAAGAQGGHGDGVGGGGVQAVPGHRGQHAVGAEFEEGGGAVPGEPVDAVGEADGVPDVVDPVVDGGELGDGGGLAGQVRHDRQQRRVEGEALDDGPERRQHRLHERRVEGVRDAQSPGPVTVGREPFGEVGDGAVVAGEHDGGGAVDGGDGHLVLVAGEQRDDGGFRCLDGDHRAAVGQGLHQAAAGGDEGGGVVQGEDAGEVGGGDLADGVAGEVVGAEAEGLDEPVERDFDGEEGGLGVGGAVEQGRVGAPQHVAQGAVEVRGEGVQGLVEGGGERREAGGEFPSRAEALGALAGEEDGEAGLGAGGAGDRGGGGGRVVVFGERGEAVGERRAVGGEQHGAVLEAGAGGGEGVGDVEQVGVRGVVEGGAQGRGLAAQGFGGAAGEQDRDGARRHGGGGRRGVGAGRGVGRPGLLGLCLGGLLDDGVGVGAADAEGGDGGAARGAGGGPVGGVGEQAHRALRPVDVPGGFLGVQGAGQHAVPHRQHHLDDAGDAGGGLGVAEVGLDRAEQQRPVRRAVLAVGGEQCLGLDGVAEGGAGAVRLDDVDVPGGQSGVDQGLLDDLLLGGAVGGGQAVGGAVLVDGGAADDGEDLVAVADGVGEAFQDEDADALGPAGAVGGVAEGAAATVRGQSALAAHLDEGAGAGHDGDAAGQGEGALAGPQCLGGQVDGDERGGAGGVDGDGGADRAEGVGDAAGQHAAGVAGELEALGAVGGADPVVLRHGADEDAGAAALHGRRVDAGAFERLPGGFQDDALLRVHGDRLARRDAEELRVEVGGVVQESAGRGRCGGECLQVPAAVGGERADAVFAGRDQSPEVFGAADASGVAAGHADDGHRFLGRRLQLADPPPGASKVGRRKLEVVPEFLFVVHLNSTHLDSRRPHVNGVRLLRVIRAGGRIATWIRHSPGESMWRVSSEFPRESPSVRKPGPITSWR